LPRVAWLQLRGRNATDMSRLKATQLGNQT